MRHLTTLDLEQNALSSLEGVDRLPRLRTLNVAKNHLSGIDSLLPLADCPSLTSLDISGNDLDLVWDEDPEPETTSGAGTDQDQHRDGAGASESKRGEVPDTWNAEPIWRRAEQGSWVSRLGAAADGIAMIDDGSSSSSFSGGRRGLAGVAAAAGLDGALGRLSLPWDLPGDDRSVTQLRNICPAAVESARGAARSAWVEVTAAASADETTSGTSRKGRRAAESAAAVSLCCALDHVSLDRGFARLAAHAIGEELERELGSPPSDETAAPADDDDTHGSEQESESESLVMVPSRQAAGSGSGSGNKLESPPARPGPLARVFLAIMGRCGRAQGMSQGTQTEGTQEVVAGGGDRSLASGEGASAGPDPSPAAGSEVPLTEEEAAIEAEDASTSQDDVPLPGAGQGLVTLTLTGNKLASRIRQYRKTLLSTLPSLMCLDERPADAAEMRAATAWRRGGAVAERAERQLIHAERLEEDRERRRQREAWVQRVRAERQAKLEAINSERKSKGLEELASLPMERRVWYGLPTSRDRLAEGGGGGSARGAGGGARGAGGGDHSAGDEDNRDGYEGTGKG